MASQKRVAIFWDYENCQPASGSSGYKVVDNIRRIALQFGAVTVFKAYLELGTTGSKVKNLRSELHSSGVSLIDCPHNGSKEVADKMLLVDMMAYVIDHPAPGTIILISGDRDFVYAVSTLRLRQYRVIVVAPSQIHPSLHRQASLAYVWNGGKIDSTRKPILPVHEEISFQRDCSFVRDTRLPLSPSSSPLPSTSRSYNGLQCVGHETPYTRTLSTRASNKSPEQYMIQEKVVGRPREAPGSLSGASELIATFPKDPLSATPNSSYNQQSIAGHRSPLTTGAHESNLSTALPVQILNVEQAVALSPTDASEPRLYVGSPSVGASASRKSFRLVGEYPRRFIRDMGQRDRVVVWKKRLERRTSGASGEPYVSDVSVGWPEKLRSRNRLNVWNKCRMTLVSLLTFKHGTSTSSVASEAMPITVSATSISPLSISPSCVIALATPAISRAITSSAVSSAEELADRAVDESATPASSETSPTSHPECPVERPREAENPLNAPVEFAYDIPSPVVEPLSQCSAQGDVSSPTDTPAVACVPLSETQTTACASANTQDALKDEQLCSDTVLGSKTAVFAGPVSIPNPLNAAIVSNLPGPSFPVAQSSIDSIVLQPRSKFVALVQELRSLRQRGLPRPIRSVVAEGIMKRDPLAYQRAGVTGGKKFDTYINLAMQAGVVTVGGKEWVSLNPAWVTPLMVFDSETPFVTSVHANPQVSAPRSAECLPGTSTTPTQNATDEFGLLVQRLQRLRSKDVPRPFCSLVAVDLVLQDDAVYRKAGVNTFDAYAALAVKAGLIELGGEGPRAWISLRA